MLRYNRNTCAVINLYCLPIEGIRNKEHKQYLWQLWPKRWNVREGLDYMEEIRFVCGTSKLLYLEFYIWIFYSCFYFLHKPLWNSYKEMRLMAPKRPPPFFFGSVQLLSCVPLFATPWTAACWASLSIANSWSLLKLMSIELVMPSNHLIPWHPLLLPPSEWLMQKIKTWIEYSNVKL